MARTPTGDEDIAGLREQIFANAAILFSPSVHKYSMNRSDSQANQPVSPSEVFDILVLKTASTSFAPVSDGSVPSSAYRAVLVCKDDWRNRLAARGELKPTVLEALAALLDITATELQHSLYAGITWDNNVVLGGILSGNGDMAMVDDDMTPYDVGE